MANTSKSKITVEENPSEQDVRVVREGLHGFNRLYAPEEDYRPLELFLREADGTVSGGLLGETYWGWLHVGVLWLEEKKRGLGYGSQLLDAAEQEALRRGCRHVHLDTLSFQALPFYEKNGYSVFGILEELPAGHRRFFLSKKLV
ncbi:MAG: GNAT family N-acetyltransferase [Anaerolineales bacterium]|jgi:GNAT superfamily N-acetyltransferase